MTIIERVTLDTVRARKQATPRTCGWVAITWASAARRVSSSQGHAG